ncbi:hypothetical protein Tco_1383726 [Tanacetum coccineum]
MELYMMNRQHGRMILESVENGPLIWPTIEENRVTRPRKYSELSATGCIQHLMLTYTSVASGSNSGKHRTVISDDLDAYDSDCDELNTASFLIGDLSPYGLDASRLRISNGFRKEVNTTLVDYAVLNQLS